MIKGFVLDDERLKPGGQVFGQAILECVGANLILDFSRHWKRGAVV